MRQIVPQPLFVRLPSDLRDWVVAEALDGRRSMNSIVIEAVNLLLVTRREERRGRKHAAAVSFAMASAEPPQGGSIITKSCQPAFQTELLLQKPGDDEPRLFARITDEKIQIVGTMNA